MPAYHPIHIRFIRRRPNGGAESNPQLDDVLSIQKLGENNLRVTYTEQTEDGVLRDTTLMTYQKMIHYLMRIFWMLSIDEDPFQSVQLMVPGYPQILIHVKAIQAHMPVLLEIIISTCWHWPTMTRWDSEEARRGGRAATSDTMPTAAPQ